MSKADNVISAFSAEHVTRITGLTNRQLSYWDATGFFKPEFVIGNDGKSRVRVYTFLDVVGLRVLNVLKSHHKVTMPHLRAVAGKLSCYSKRPWSELKLMVSNREVHFLEPETRKTRSVLTGQYVLLPLIDVMEDVKKSAAELVKRKETEYGRFERHRNISHNAQVIAGTRIPVRAVRHFLEDGYSIPAILKQYPTLTCEDIEAVAKEAGLQTAA